MTAWHWRSLRAKLLKSGIGDPMGLPSMHALFDLTEEALCESIAANADSVREGQMAVDEFIESMYAEPVEPEKAAAGYRPTPSWFDGESSEDDFDAMIRNAPR